MAQETRHDEFFRRSPLPDSRTRPGASRNNLKNIILAALAAIGLGTASYKIADSLSSHDNQALTHKSTELANNEKNKFVDNPAKLLADYEEAIKNNTLPDFLKTHPGISPENDLMAGNKGVAFLNHPAVVVDDGENMSPLRLNPGTHISDVTSNHLDGLSIGTDDKQVTWVMAQAEVPFLLGKRDQIVYFNEAEAVKIPPENSKT